jgi:hypothetical protein
MAYVKKWRKNYSFDKGAKNFSYPFWPVTFRTHIFSTLAIVLFFCTQFKFNVDDRCHGISINIWFMTWKVELVCWILRNSAWVNLLWINQVVDELRTFEVMFIYHLWSHDGVFDRYSLNSISIFSFYLKFIIL